MLRVEVHEDEASAALILKRLEAVLEAVRILYGKVDHMSAELEKVKQETTEAVTVMKSAKVLIEGLAEQIRSNADNPTALLEIADKLDSGSNELAAAVSANTPAEEPPVEPPSEPPTA
jgi:hypothetical protein